MAAIHDRLAVLAERREFHGGLVNFGGLVVEGPRQDARRGGFAHAAHAGEHPGLRDAARRECVGEGADHRLLADEARKIGRPVFSRKNAVGAGGLACLVASGFAHSPVLLHWPTVLGRFQKRECRPRRNAPSMSRRPGKAVCEEVGGWNNDPFRAR
jgi:hypothetical protein